MTYLTGDTHGRFERILAFCKENATTVADTLIILGDAALNYYGDKRDDPEKKLLSEASVTLFCIHGNHERRPHTIPTYREKTYRGGTVWYEEAYPNLLFAKDGELYDFDGKKCVVIGGAYSVDKAFRLAAGWLWFPDEQPSAEIKRRVEERLAAADYRVDAVLSHTCPLKYEPVEVFMKGIDQSKVDKTTETWLDGIESRLSYDKWYCGHYHTEKTIDKLQFMYEDYAVL